MTLTNRVQIYFTRIHFTCFNSTHLFWHLFFLQMSSEKKEQKIYNPTSSGINKGRKWKTRWIGEFTEACFSFFLFYAPFSALACIYGHRANPSIQMFLPLGHLFIFILSFLFFEKKYIKKTTTMYEY